jgi:hypothetical protein
MRSKTLSLINRHIRLIKEQGEGEVPMEDPSQQMPPPEGQAPPAPAPEPATEMPFTAASENMYVKFMVDMGTKWMSDTKNTEEATQLNDLSEQFASGNNINAKQVFQQFLKIINPHMGEGISELLDQI